MVEHKMSTNAENNSLECHVPNKWKKLLTHALQMVQKQVHPSLNAKNDALEYIEELIIQLLRMLCQTQPHSVADVEDQIKKTFPKPIDKWSTTEAQLAIGKKKSALVLPVDKIHPLLKEELGYKIDGQVTMYIVAVLEYIAADILKLTGNYVKNIKHSDISLQDIKIAMCADKELMEIFCGDDDDDLDRTEDDNISICQTENMTYEDLVKDLIHEETQYLRDLNMILVFRTIFAELYPNSKDLETIFSNILEVLQLTHNLLSSLEDTVEATEEDTTPLIGTCFENLAEGEEFDIYFKYTEDVLSPSGRERLYALLERQDLKDECKKYEQDFRGAVKYILPKLLLWPIFHFLKYSDILNTLMVKSLDDEDKESLQNTYGQMHPLKLDIERKLNSMKKRQGELVILPRLHTRTDSMAAVNKINEIQRSIDGWEGRDITHSCKELVMEGALYKLVKGRQSDRYVFLFNGLVVITKQSTRRSVTGPSSDYRFKEKYNLRRISVVDHEDTSEIKNAFELTIRDAPCIIFTAKSMDEKASWMAALLWLIKGSLLDRILEIKLSQNTKEKPLCLPHAPLYRFSEKDQIDVNIVFEDDAAQSGGDEGRLIKGGTLVKLIERLTYHMYADLRFVKTFLITYRTFCMPQEFLSLLIQRFKIPDPPQLKGADEGLDPESISRRDDLKRFRKLYAKPVQFRVLNVLRQWVERHWYDFENNQELQQELADFVDNAIHDKAMRKWAETIRKQIARKKELVGCETPKMMTFYQDKPNIEWHITRIKEDFDLMTLHPIELARQVTLLEMDLYRAVKPSEMVGSVWVKKQKHITSQNLMKIIEFSTRFTFWLMRCIVDTENFEERVAVLTRVIEIMAIFIELNNFSGLFEAAGALNSAPVHRLEWTFDEVRQKHHKLMRVFDEANDLRDDHSKKYHERLRSINPPCVPFLGTYLTSILLTEEGNPDFLPNRPEGIINFSKRRKVAEMCTEIQQYQDQHYCLEVEPSIRSFLENLDPLQGLSEKEFNDYLYTKSLEMEPRNAKQPVKFEKRREYPLKSPGIKVRHASISSISSLASLRPSVISHNSSLQRLGEDTAEEQSSIYSGPSPPTPSTPISPTHDSSFQEASSDAGVMSPGSSSVFRSSPTPFQLPPHEEEKEEEKPPPLPPRGRRRESSNDLSPNSPSVCSRFAFDDIPPPLPPRTRNRAEILYGLGQSRGAWGGSCFTLPRTMGRPPPFHPSATSLFPRRNSDRDELNEGAVFNGNQATPQLPPRTYRAVVSHNRQQSS